MNARALAGASRWIALCRFFRILSWWGNDETFALVSRIDAGCKRRRGLRTGPRPGWSCEREPALRLGSRRVFDGRRPSHSRVLRATLSLAATRPSEEIRTDRAAAARMAEEDAAA